MFSVRKELSLFSLLIPLFSFLVDICNTPFCCSSEASKREMGSHCSRAAESEEEYEDEETESSDHDGVTPAPAAAPPSQSKNANNVDLSGSDRSADSLRRNFSHTQVKNESSHKSAGSTATATKTTTTQNNNTNQFMSPVPVTEPRLNPLQADNDCSDGRSTPSDFEAPAENPSSPSAGHAASSHMPAVAIGLDVAGGQHTRVVISPSTTTNAQNYAAAPVAAPSLSPTPILAIGSGSNPAAVAARGIPPDVFNEDYRVRIGKCLQNKFIRGLALVKVNEMITHPFACQHSVLVGALQDLRGERLRQSFFSLQLLMQKADVILKYRITQTNEQFNSTLLGKAGLLGAPDVPLGQGQTEADKGARINRTILYASACGVPHFTQVMAKYQAFASGKAAKRRLESEIHVTHATSTVFPSTIRKGKKSRVKYDREVLMWMTSGTEHGATFVHTLVPDALMNLDLIDKDISRATGVAIRMTLTKLYDQAKDRCSADAITSKTQFDFMRVPNIEMTMLYIRSNMLYSSMTAGFAPPVMFIIHTNHTIPEAHELFEAPDEAASTQEDDTSSVYSLRSVVSNSGSMSQHSRSSGKLRYDLPPVTSYSLNLSEAVLASTARNLDCPAPPLLAFVAGTPTFWNVLNRNDVAEMLKCMLDLDKSVILRSPLPEVIAPLIRKYKALRSFVKRSEAEQKLMMQEGGLRRLRNTNSDMCEALREEAVLRCGKDEANGQNCAVAIMTTRVDHI